jgi:PEGA domain
MRIDYSRRLISAITLAIVICAGLPAFAQQHRSGGTNRGGNGNRTVITRQAPTVSASRQVAPRGYRSVAPAVVVGRSTSRNIGPRFGISVGSTRFYRPYYEFRPRLRVSAGFFIGFPVAYSYGYYNPYAYSQYGYYDPYSSSPYGYPDPTYGYPDPTYGYPAAPATSYPTYPPQAYPGSPSSSPGSVVVQPNQMNTGGASFEITPSTAEVLVDGISMGPASQFTPMTAPIGLTPGHHHFEVRAPGYQTLAFDADIVAGQVTPFQGTLQR